MVVANVVRKHFFLEIFLIWGLGEYVILFPHNYAFMRQRS